jgi:hypothetical protein
MSKEPGRFSPKNALGVIALFVGVVELAFAYPVTVLAGPEKIAFVIFMIVFPVFVFSGFLFVLVRHPEKFYSPSDFEDPTAFVRLVERRDGSLNEHLQVRTKTIIESTESLLSLAKANRDALGEITKRIGNLPELDRDLLELDFARIREILQETRESLATKHLHNLEMFLNGRLEQIAAVWIDFESSKGPWQLWYLAQAAAASFKDIRKREIENQGGTGEVSLEDYDAIHRFEYSYEIGVLGNKLTIKHSHSYSTVM